eukprot:scaffold58266_cov20-Tisochrysis_lutea.AAC.1
MQDAHAGGYRARCTPSSTAGQQLFHTTLFMAKCFSVWCGLQDATARECRSCCSAAPTAQLLDDTPAPTSSPAGCQAASPVTPAECTGLWRPCNRPGPRRAAAVQGGQVHVRGCGSDVFGARCPSCACCVCNGPGMSCARVARRVGFVTGFMLFRVGVRAGTEALHVVQGGSFLVGVRAEAEA